MELTKEQETLLDVALLSISKLPTSHSAFNKILWRAFDLGMLHQKHVSSNSSVKYKNLNEILECAVAAIYLDDSSDYLASLWTIVRNISPCVAKMLEDDPQKAYAFVKKETK